MSQTPHTLAAAFPDHAAQIKSLRQSDSHFAKLTASYDEVNTMVHLAETDVAPSSDDHITKMRKQRMVLRDQIAGYLR